MSCGVWNLHELFIRTLLVRDHFTVDSIAWQTHTHTDTHTFTNRYPQLNIHDPEDYHRAFHTKK